MQGILSILSIIAYSILDYEKIKDETIKTIEDFEFYLLSPGNTKEKIADTKKRIKDIILLHFKTVEKKVDSKFGYFERFGVDMMFDEQYNPYLMVLK